MRSRHSFLLSSLLIFALVAFAAGCSQSAEGNEESSTWSFFRTQSAVVPAGTPLKVRLTTGLSSAKNSGGDTFEGTLENDVVVGDTVVFSKGTDVEGKVTHAVESGRLKERAELWVTLTEVDGNEVKTSTVGRKEGSKTKRDILIIGGSSGAGALIGGLAGGGKGAAIGAGVGAGGGTAAAALTGKRDIVFPPETVLRFVLKEDTKVEL
jgi:hypothetical protein